MMDVSPAPNAESATPGAGLGPEEKWRKLRAWLREKVSELQAGDMGRLPHSLGGPATEVSLVAFETVLAAMDLIDAGKA